MTNGPSFLTRADGCKLVRSTCWEACASKWKYNLCL